MLSQLLLKNKALHRSVYPRFLPKWSHYLLHLMLIALLLVIAFIPVESHALAQDKLAKAQFIADHVTFNHITGTTVFTGKVKMDQGTTRLLGDKVTVYRLPNGIINKVIALGNLAHYRTLPDNQKQELDAYAQRIEYYPIRGIAVLIGRGEIVQGLNSFRGPYIVYDMQKQIITSTPASTKTQSVIVIQPQDLPKFDNSKVDPVSKQTTGNNG